jgi:hypothetical protein
MQNVSPWNAFSKAIIVGRFRVKEKLQSYFDSHFDSSGTIVRENTLLIIR